MLSQQDSKFGKVNPQRARGAYSLQVRLYKNFYYANARLLFISQNHVPLLVYKEQLRHGFPKFKNKI